MKPPSARPSSQPAASICQDRGQAAKATSIRNPVGRPTEPASIQSRSVATPGDEAKGKLTAPRPPASATRARAAATSTANGFSQNTGRPAARAARAWPTWEAGGEAT